MTARSCRHAPTLIATGALLAATLTTTVAFGQWGRQKAPRQPAAQAGPRPIITRNVTTRQDWTLKAEVSLLGYQYRASVNQALVPTATINVNSAAVVYPRLGDTSFSRAHTERYKGRVRTGSIVHDDEPVFLDGYQGPTSLAVWELGQIDATNLVLEVEMSNASYEVEVDEERARQIGWPEKEYPPEIAQNLQPQLFVQSTHPDVMKLVEHWTQGNVKGAKPYDAAKALAGEVVKYFQPSGQGFESVGRGNQTVIINAVLIEGFEVNGAAVAARLGKGSEHDMACLLTAVYRAAGIPARMVICYDEKEQREEDATYPVIRALVEFYLFDEATGFGQWIPVDIVKQREFSSRPPRLEQTWEYFGRHRDSEYLIPIAHHWHPPEAVTNTGPAAIWGWFPTNGNPVADSHLSFTHRTMSKSTKDMEDIRKEQRRGRP